MRAARAIAIAIPLVAARAMAADPLPQQPAAEIDPAPFSHARSITVPPSPEGVSRVRIDPAALAVARADLADVRVVDAASRQWPYVLRTEVDHEESSLGIDLAAGDRGHSRYRLTPQVAPASIDAITLKIDRAFFDRPYRLLTDAAPRRASLATGRLTRASGAPDTIVIAFAKTRVTSIELLVDDGDEAPLPILAATASLPLAEIRVVAPPGAYTLLVGDAAAEPPRYEIARLRDRVLAAEAPLCETGPLAARPEHRAPPPPPFTDEQGQRAVWAVMGLAVVGLGWLTLRLSRKEQQKAASPGADQGAATQGRTDTDVRKDG